MRKLFMLTTLFIGFFSCSPEYVKTKGFIKERKKIVGDSLQLYFDFIDNGKSFSDSIVVKSLILSSDTVWVSYPKNNPKSAVLLLR